MFNFLKKSYSKVKGALEKTSSHLQHKIQTLLKGKIDEEALQSLEQIFYEADLGVKLALELTFKVKKELQKNPGIERSLLMNIIRDELTCELGKHSTAMNEAEKGEPTIILIVGVNGSGKTTSIAKLAHLYQKEGKEVLISAADTFRAAAVHQLELWAEKLGIDLIKSAPKSDPSSVVFDAITAAKARQSDLLLIDTAGRLHVKTDLMQELQKIRRVCTKLIPSAPHETLLVLDATMGQNAIEQARTFHKFTPITGIILTKLDGTTKGGIALAIEKELGIPIKFIGIGEGLDDLQPFDEKSFASALLGLEPT